MVAVLRQEKKLDDILRVNFSKGENEATFEQLWDIRSQVIEKYAGKSIEELRKKGTLVRDEQSQQETAEKQKRLEENRKKIIVDAVAGATKFPIELQTPEFT